MASKSNHRSGIRLRRVTHAERTCKRLAEMGVPRSMVAELTGLDCERPEDATAEVASRFAALTNLTQVYYDIAMNRRRAFASLADAIESAAALGVLYEPPCMTQARLAERASWERAARVFASRALDVWQAYAEGDGVEVRMGKGTLG